jgi:hypothetical protein
VLAATLTTALLAAAAPAPAAAVADTPAHTFLRKVVGLADDKIAAIDAGQVVTKPLPAADKPEIAVFGAVRVRGDRAAIVDQIRRDVGVVRRNALVLEIGRFSTPPRVEDLAGLTLDAGDFEAARKCKPGDCSIKLARSAIDRIQRELDWKAPDARARATALMRQMFVEYTAAYRSGGTAEMATYVDKNQPLEAPAEFRKLLAASPYLVDYTPALQQYLEQYPKATLSGAEDVFYWWKDSFGPKPTMSIYHVTIWTNPERPVTVIASKRIYASHYFQAGFELMAVVTAPEGGVYLMDLYRVRIDPPTGVLSGVILGKIRGGIEQEVAEGLKSRAAAQPPTN